MEPNTLFAGGMVVLLLAACSMADFNGQNEAQKQAAIQQCQETYGSCQESCNEYWLASDKENCKAQCTDDYQVCMSYT